VTGHLGEIIQFLQAVAATRPTILLGIDGLGGAGKTVLAAALAGSLRSAGRTAAVVHFDDFFLPSARRPRGTPLRANQVARYRRYDWMLHALAEVHEIAPNCTVIVEGVSCTRRELADLYDLRVWVDCPRELRLARGIRRDGEAAR
jgi:uridine kinase